MTREPSECLMTVRHEMLRFDGARIANCRLVVFEDSSHALQLDEPDLFRTVVTQFVAATGD